MKTTKTVGAKPIQVLVPNEPSARRTMQALRDLGYDSYGSILDLLDNSVDADAKNIEITVGEKKGDIYITIQDDGRGMDLTTLSEALRLGSELDHTPGDLGKFGMGMVTASIGLARKLEVASRTEGAGLVEGGFDLDDIYEEGRFVKWLAEDEDVFDDRLMPTGTLLSLTKVDRISNRDTTTFANTLRRRIGQVFRKFLKAGVSIVVNNRPAEPIDPLMLQDPKTTVLFDDTIEVAEGRSLSLRVVELPDYGLATNKELGIIPQDSGFYIVRNNREILAAHAFDFYKKHADYSHFRAEVCFTDELDDIFNTDVKKMGINPPRSVLDRLQQASVTLIKQIARAGRRRANVSKGEIDHSIAQGNIARRATLIPKPKALIERRAPRQNTGATRREGTGERSRTPHVGDLRTVTGLKITFEEANRGEHAPYFTVDQKASTIIIEYNRDHVFWREYLEHADDPKTVAILDHLTFALANAQLLVPDQAKTVMLQVNATLVGLFV